MVDPNAVVSLPGAGLVVPEGVSVGRIRVEGAVGVRVAEMKNGAEGSAAFWPEKSVISPGVRIMAVDRLGNDVPVSAQHDSLLQAQQLTGPGLQTLHPCELVIELLARDGITVWQVDGGNTQVADGRFEIAGLLVFRVTRQNGQNLFDRLSREEGHTIVGLLPDDGTMVPCCFQFQPGKGILNAFRLLQHHDVRRKFVEPLQQVWQAHLDGVHVPGSDLHLQSVGMRQVAQTLTSGLNSLQHRPEEGALSPLGATPYIGEAVITVTVGPVGDEYEQRYRSTVPDP